MQDLSIHIPVLQHDKKVLLDNVDCIISNGHKYGLIGLNGTGKTSLLNYIMKSKELKDVDKHMVNQESPISDTLTVYNTVLQSNTKLFNILQRIEELEILMEQDVDSENEKLNDEYYLLQDKLDELDFNRENSKIRKILHGLGFINEQQDLPNSSFSGGWRMRIALACALYREPTLLLLDEPTNHLDLEANIWLIDYLSKYQKTIIVISHNIEFLNEICTDIIHLENMKLNYYKGNYSKFKKAYDQKLTEMTKTIEKEEKKIMEWKKSGKKTKKDIDEYLKKTPLPILPKPYFVRINFTNIPEDDTNLIEVSDVSFSYNENKKILDNVSLGLNTNSRYTIVGKNGVGKSTMMKIIMKELIPTSGFVKMNEHINVGYFHQHTTEQLPGELTPVEYLMGLDKKLNEQNIREYLGRIALEGTHHKKKISELSGGQKVRLCLCELQIRQPDVLLLDEPTNHLDIYSIEALIEAINNFNGAVLIISHDSNLINETNCQVLELDNYKLNKTTYDEYVDKIINEFV